MDFSALKNRLRLKAGKDDAIVGVVASFATDVKIERDRNIEVIANTDDIDLQDEVVVPSGADTDYIVRNGKVFADHMYGMTDVVGSIRYIAKYPTPKDHRAWKARIQMLALAGNSLPDDILTIAREVGIGVSIGFEAVDYGPPTEDESKAYTGKTGPPRSVVRRWKWLELSFTAFPANVACQSVVGVMDETRAAALDQLVTKGAVRRASAVALGLPDRKIYAPFSVAMSELI